MRWTSHERRARRSILLLPAEKAINFGFLYKQFKSLSGFVHQATSSVISLKRDATFPSQGKACASRRRLRLCHQSMKLYLYIFCVLIILNTLTPLVQNRAFMKAGERFFLPFART